MNPGLNYVKLIFKNFFCFGSGYKMSNEILNLQNPFWIDTTAAWSEYCNKIEIESAQHILDSPLWYNKNLINGQHFI